MLCNKKKVNHWFSKKKQICLLMLCLYHRLFVGGFMSYLYNLCLVLYSTVQLFVLLYVFMFSVPCCDVRVLKSPISISTKHIYNKWRNIHTMPEGVSAPISATIRCSGQTNFLLLRRGFLFNLCYLYLFT